MLASCPGLSPGQKHGYKQISKWEKCANLETFVKSQFQCINCVSAFTIKYFLTKSKIAGRTCNLEVRPTRTFNLEVRPTRTCNLVVRPSRTCNLVVKPTRTCNLVVRPTRTCILVVRPTSLCNLELRPRRNC